MSPPAAQIPPSDPDQTAVLAVDAAHPRAPAIAAWHLAWAAASGVLALGAGWFGGAWAHSILWGLLVLGLPGLGGLVLLKRADTPARMGLMYGWCLATVIASALTGGLSGPLAGMIAMPVAAALALGDARKIQIGALGAAAAALLGAATTKVAGLPPAAPILSAAGAVVVAAAVILAVRLTGADRARRLDRAEDQAARADRLLAGQPGLALLMEPSGRVLAAYGSPPVALPVDPLFEQGLIGLVHAPDRPAILSAIDKALNGAESQVLFSPRGALDRRIIMIFKRFDDDAKEGGGARLIVQAFDGTLQYARELALETARAEAEASSAGKTRFLANMSHELRTPLNAVLGFSDMMRERIFGPLPERYAEYAESIHTAGGHLLELINDVLDVSKIEAERYRLSRELFDARDVVSAAVALVRVAADDKRVELNAVLPAGPLKITADRRALKQMALNLLSNAVKFTPAGGSVTVTLESIGPYLELVVSDTGVGIAPEDLQRLGRPFEQAGDAEQRSQGTGLGLSLVRSLAELHGGRMSLESTLGAGTAVTVRLPVITVGRPVAA
ncbi:HAMP domain-containing sensor histidine kinase [Brevundimonas sp. Leaf363]|uniref:sensor histidine kinase n=1 Tax=Brevundimonas sp. Leaf363 TaxID=1736353 RepID=UPI000A6A6472|nr:HAMP domain-containing sensor histidine kinase [Brevundimonas sp. Leaf363]